MRIRTLHTGLLVAALLYLGGCAATPTPPAGDSWTRYWPPPPERPLYVVEAQIRFIEDIRRADAGATLRNALGVGGPGRTPAFVKPIDVAVSRGQVYVSDQGTASVHVFDIPNRRFHRFGYRGPGTLRKPMGLAIDANMQVYVVDAGARAVRIYDRLGLHLRTLFPSERLIQPVAVAVSADGQRIFVLDRGGVDSDHHRVVVFDDQGRHVTTLGGLGSAAGRLRLPMDIEVTGEGSVIVLDSGNFRVQVWRPDGTVENEWGGAGTGPGLFGRPRALALDAAGIVYVADSFFADIKAFARDGRPLLPIGNKGSGDTPGSLRLVTGIDADETGRVYAIDQASRSLHVFRRLEPVAEIVRSATAPASGAGLAQ